MDAQAMLQQKDAELEQRAALLLKTKAAIENLQEELAGARQEADHWRKAAERQGSQLADAQRHEHLLEAELQDKAREGAALLADNMALKRKVQDAHDGLRGASDAASAQHGALAGRLKDLEQALAEAQAEARGARQDAAAAQAAAGDRGRLLEEATAALRHLEARHSAAEAGRATAEQQLAAEQRAKAELSTAVEQLQGRLSASASEAEARLAAEADARKQAEQACASAREILADEQKLRALDRKDAAERLAAHEASAAAAAERATAAAAAAADRAAAAAAAALDEAKRGLKKRLYLAEGEWAQRVQATAADWAQRCAAEEAARAAERAQLLHDMEARLGQVAAAQAAAVEDTKATYRRRVAVAEDKSAAATQAADRVWQQRLEAAVERAEREGQAAVASAARAAAQREQHLQAQLAAAQEGTAGRMAELDKQWALCLAAAEERGLRERHELERQCADRLHAQERAAAEAQAALRSSLEARLASASERVGAIAQRQDRQERKRAELLCQIAALEASVEGERGRRQEADAALQEASAIFKRELADKNGQLELLRQEMKNLRSMAAGAGSLPGVHEAAALGLLGAGPPLSPPRSASPCPAGSLCPSPDRWLHGGAPHMHCCFSAPTSPARPAAAAASNAVDAEVRALRASRRAYQRAALGQLDLASSMAHSINEAIRRDGEGGAGVEAAVPAPYRPRPQSAGAGIPAGGRRRWGAKRNLGGFADEIRAICGRAGMQAAAAAVL